MVMRDHDVSGLAVGQLQRVRRDLAASLVLARPGSPACRPVTAQLRVIDAQLAVRAAATGPVPPQAAP
jgi:hypothetical protein